MDNLVLSEDYSDVLMVITKTNQKTTDKFSIGVYDKILNITLSYRYHNNFNY
jgi:hypothetical protein